MNEELLLSIGIDINALKKSLKLAEKPVRDYAGTSSKIFEENRKKEILEKSKATKAKTKLIKESLQKELSLELESILKKDKIQKDAFKKELTLYRKSAEYITKVRTSGFNQFRRIQSSIIKEAKKSSNYRDMLIKNSAKIEVKVYQDIMKLRVANYKIGLKQELALDKERARKSLLVTKRLEAERASARKSASTLMKPTAEKFQGSGGSTSFGHKVSSTAQYMAAGVALYGVASAFRSVIEESFRFDKALFKNMAVLNTTRREAEALANSAREVSSAYGGQIADIDEVTLILGRAGVATEKLADATKAVVEMATITGDTFADTSKVISTFTTTFGEAGYSVNKLKDLLALAANESKMSTQDLGTLSNYALVTAKTIGMTAESTLALATSFSRLGLNSSTIGTQIRKLDVLFKGTSKSMGVFWKAIGGNQRELASQLRKGGGDGEKVLIELVRRIGSISKESFADATAGMNILNRSLVTNLRASEGMFEDYLIKMKAGGVDVSLQARAVAQSTSSIFERIGNQFYTLADDAVTSMSDMAFSRKEVSKLSDKLSSLTSGTQEYIDTANKMKAMLDSNDNMIKDYTSSVMDATVKLAEFGAIFIAGGLILSTGSKIIKAGAMAWLLMTTKINGTTAALLRLSRASLAVKGGVVGMVAFLGYEASTLIYDNFFNNDKSAEKTAKDIDIIKTKAKSLADVMRLIKNSQGYSAIGDDNIKQKEYQVEMLNKRLIVSNRVLKAINDSPKLSTLMDANSWKKASSEIKQEITIITGQLSLLESNKLSAKYYKDVATIRYESEKKILDLQLKNNPTLDSGYTKIKIQGLKEELILLKKAEESKKKTASVRRVSLQIISQEIKLKKDLASEEKATSNKKKKLIKLQKEALYWENRAAGFVKDKLKTLNSELIALNTKLSTETGITKQFLLREKIAKKQIEISKTEKQDKAKLKDFTKTLSQSVSVGLVNALGSGDVARAIQSLGANIGSSFIQTSISNMYAVKKAKGSYGVDGNLTSKASGQIKSNAITGAVGFGASLASSYAKSQGATGIATGISGAMAGFAIGGPVGATIGGAVGLLVGTIMEKKQSAEDKAIESLSKMSAEADKSSKGLAALGLAGSAFNKSINKLIEWQKAEQKAGGYTLAGKLGNEINDRINAESLSMFDVSKVTVEQAKKKIEDSYYRNNKESYGYDFTRGMGKSTSKYYNKFDFKAYQKIKDEIQSLMMKGNKDGFDAVDLARRKELLSSALYGIGKDLEKFNDIILKSQEESKANIKKWTQRNETEIESLRRIGKDLGVEPSAKLDDLVNVFERLSVSGTGLTSIELDFLQRNEEYIKSLKDANGVVQKLTISTEQMASTIAKMIKEKNDRELQTTADAYASKFEIQQKGYERQKKALQDYLSSVGKNISTLSNAINPLANVIGTLKGTNLQNFYDLMSNSLNLSGGTEYEKFATSLNKTIGASNILNDSSIFGSRADMDFAKAIAANQFQRMEDAGLTQIDVLKKIEENTRTQVDYLGSLISELGVKISTIKSSPSTVNRLQSSFADVKSVKEGWKQHGFDKDNSGWLNKSEVSKATGGDMSWFSSQAMEIRKMAQELAPIYGGGYEIDYAGFKRSLSTLSTYGKEVLGYSNGGYTGASNGVVHPNEYVLNAETSSSIGLNDSSSTGVFGKIVTQLGILADENRDMKQLLVKITANSDRQLKTQRGIEANTYLSA